MLTIEKRIAALESSASDTALKIIIVEDGETQDQALKRLGLPPDARDVIWGVPMDVQL
jgi:hypothetical protein